LALCVVVLGAALVSASTSSENEGWIEPAYADAVTDTTSLLEDGTAVGSGAKGRIRGIPHTVGGRRGMVTYISPARKVQTSGFVFTPPPVMTVESHEEVEPLPRVWWGPRHHHHHPHMHHAHHMHRGHAHVHDHVDHAHAHAYVNGHHTHFPLAENAQHQFVHSRPSQWGVPASLFAEPAHMPHYGHVSATSQGTIVVPHTPEGGLTLEEPGFTGYNPGSVYAVDSHPIGFYSNGIPYRPRVMASYG